MLLLRAGTREKIQDKACSDCGGMSGQGAKKRRMMEYTIQPINVIASEAKQSV
jgi:hypothetical protein